MTKLILVELVAQYQPRKLQNTMLPIQIFGT